MQKAFYTLLFSASFGILSAQTGGTCTLLKDINPGTSNSLPVNKTLYKNKVYFQANNGLAANGSELWVTDGTSAGTVMVKDINPGTAGGTPANLAVYGDFLYFNGNGGVTEGAELWRTDGTAAGTVLVKDINTGSAASAVGRIFVAFNKMLFSATDGTSGSQLFESDGTAAGTKLLKRINQSPTANAAPSNYVLFKNKVYFTATDTLYGNELWETDGTAAGTKLVKDIWPGPTGSAISGITPIGNTYLIFRAMDTTGNTELWRSDGTTAGTVLVKDIWPGFNATGAAKNGSAPTNLTAVGNRVFFTATENTRTGSELWVTDGTEAGTRIVKNIAVRDSTSSAPSQFIEWQGKLYFRASNGITGSEVYVSDGTEAGTVIVKDINSAGDASPANFCKYGGKLYFQANDGVTAIELWETDGTAAGTKMACDIRPGTGGGGPSLIDAYLGSLLFSAQNDTSGTELFIYRTAAGVSTKEAANFSLSLKPSIATDVLTLDIHAEGLAKGGFVISDITGRTLVSKQLSILAGLTTETIDISPLPVGMHILTLQLGAEKLAMKFIKQ
jgi:ELWxxDGT repeat protein